MRQIGELSIGSSNMSMAAPSSQDCVPHGRRPYSGTREVEENYLDSDLWGTMPEQLHFLILGKVPFSGLLRFCFVCKLWRDFILSNHAFFFFHKGCLMARRSLIPSGKWGMWQSVPLQYLQVEPSTLNMVSSAGGMLCFSTHEYGEYIICNPLTQRHKRVQAPSGLLTGHERFAPDPWLPPPEDDWLTHSWHPMETLACLVLIPNTGHFKLIVAAVHMYAGGATVVYDSRVDSWKQVDYLTHSMLFLGKHVSCNGGIYSIVHFHKTAGGLVRYDVEKETWVWIPKPVELGLTQNLIEYKGKVYYITLKKSPKHEYRFFELQDSGRRLELSLTPISPTLSQMMDEVSHGFPEFLRTDMTLLDFQYFGQGDVVCYLARIDQSLAQSVPGPSSLRMWVHEFSTNSDLISGWEDWPLIERPSYVDCQIFKPSMLNPL